MVVLLYCQDGKDESVKEIYDRSAMDSNSKVQLTFVSLKVQKDTNIQWRFNCFYEHPMGVSKIQY